MILTIQLANNIIYLLYLNFEVACLRIVSSKSLGANLVRKRDVSCVANSVHLLITNQWTIFIFYYESKFNSISMSFLVFFFFEHLWNLLFFL